MAETLAAVFGKPFPEQVAAFRLRLGNLVPTSVWTDLERAGHDTGFMVAGALKAELLADLAAAVQKSIEAGTTLEEFRKDFRQIVTKHGWHGWTGEGTAKGEAWRTRVIYRTNLSTSYAAGRLAQLIAGKFKFWVYRHGGSQEPRVQHLAWNGVALEPDHPFWTSHAPPNGWGCSCYVVGARSEAGIRRLGGTPGKKLPEGWQAPDPRTGAPVGIDKGWDYSPGRSVTAKINALRPALDRLPEPVSVDMVQSWLQSHAFASWYARPLGAWPLARISDADAAKVGASTRVVELSPETLLKQLREHPEMTIADYMMAQTVISTSPPPIQDGPLSLIYVLEMPGNEATGGYVLVVKATRTGKGLFVTSFRRLSRDDAGRDREVRRLLSKGEK